MNANDAAFALFLADIFTLDNEEETPAVPPGDWRDVEGPDEAPDAD